MSAVTFSGLSSGLDTSALITQLVAAERQPADAIASHQQDLNTQKSIVGSLSTALVSLGTAARGLDLDLDVQPRTVASSDSHVSVTASSGAAVTTHDVRVKQLARASVTTSRTFASQDAGVLGAGSVDITTSGTTKTISWDATDSLSSIASKINAAGVDASASVLYDGTSYRLVVSGTKTGTTAAPSFVDSGDSLGLSDPANVKIGAQDAIVTIDGIDVTRGKNVIDDAVSGLTFTLQSPHGATEPDGAVTVSQDTNALRDKVKAVVGAYNSINAALHVQLDYNGQTKGTNTLFGDSTLRQLQGALGSLMSNAYGSSTLSTIGLSRSSDGTMTLDETKLASALSTNPDAVKDLFVTGGFATAITTLADGYTRAGDGILSSKSQSLTDRYNTLQKQADQINANADALQTRLEGQFTALETAMTQLKSQLSYISKIFG